MLLLLRYLACITVIAATKSTTSITILWSRIALFVGAFQLVRIFGRGGLARSVTRLQDKLLRLTLQRTRHVWE